MANEAPKSPAGGGGGGTGLAPNVASLLCYICTPISSIIFIVLEKSNPDVKFHAWQGTFLGCAWIGLWIVINILVMILPFIGFLFPIISLAFFVLWVICLIKAYQGERWKLPVIGDMAAKKAGI